MSKIIIEDINNFIADNIISKDKGQQAIVALLLYIKSKDEHFKNGIEIYNEPGKDFVFNKDDFGEVHDVILCDDLIMYTEFGEHMYSETSCGVTIQNFYVSVHYFRLYKESEKERDKYCIVEGSYNQLKTEYMFGRAARLLRDEGFVGDEFVYAVDAKYPTSWYHPEEDYNKIREAYDAKIAELKEIEDLGL